MKGSIEAPVLVERSFAGLRPDRVRHNGPVLIPYTGPLRIAGVGPSNVDIHVRGLDPQKTPDEVYRRATVGGVLLSKIAVPEVRKIEELEEIVVAEGAETFKTPAGNIGTILGVMSSLLEEGTVRVDTPVGRDPDGKLIRRDLRTRDNLQSVFHRIKGRTPVSIVIPAWIDEKPDRLAFTHKPQNIQSKFKEYLPQDLDFAVVNSLAGPHWAQDLREGVDELTNRIPPVPYIYTPGSLQLGAIIDASDPGKRDQTKIDAVYHAVRNAHILSLDVGELKTLMKGHGYQKEYLDGLHKELLLKQAHDVLGSKVIMVTDGKHGSWGYDSIKDPHNVWHIGMKPDKPGAEIKSTIGAGDRFIGAAGLQYFMSGDIREALRWGTVSGSQAVLVYGARDKLPTRDAFTSLLAERDTPRAYIDKARLISTK